MVPTTLQPLPSVLSVVEMVVPVYLCGDVLSESTPVPGVISVLCATASVTRTGRLSVRVLTVVMGKFLWSEGNRNILTVKSKLVILSCRLRKSILPLTLSPPVSESKEGLLLVFISNNPVLECRPPILVNTPNTKGRPPRGGHNSFIPL